MKPNQQNGKFLNTMTKDYKGKTKQKSFKLWIMWMKVLLDGLDGGELVGVGLDADARVETQGQQVVHDLQRKSGFIWQVLPAVKAIHKQHINDFQIKSRVLLNWDEIKLS